MKSGQKVIKTKYGDMYIDDYADDEDIQFALKDLEKYYLKTHPGARTDIAESAASDTETKKRAEAANKLYPVEKPPETKQDTLKSGKSLLTPGERVSMNELRNRALRKKKEMIKVGERKDQGIFHNMAGFFGLADSRRNKQIDEALQRSAAYDQSLGAGKRQTPQVDYRNDANTSLAKQQKNMYAGAGVQNDYLGPAWIKDQMEAFNNPWTSIADTLGVQVQSLKLAAAAAGGLAAAWLLFAPSGRRR